MNICEDCIFDCFAQLVALLSEEKFQPFVYRIYQWTVFGESPSEYTFTFYDLIFM